MVCLACTCIYLSFKSESTSRHQWFFRENACIIEKVACSHIVTGIQHNVITSQYSGKTIPYIMIIQKGHVIYATLILIKYEYMYKVSTQKKKFTTMHYMYKNLCSFPSFFSWHLNQQEKYHCPFLTHVSQKIC